MRVFKKTSPCTVQFVETRDKSRCRQYRSVVLQEAAMYFFHPALQLFIAVHFSCFRRNLVQFIFQVQASGDGSGPPSSLALNFQTIFQRIPKVCPCFEPKNERRYIAQKHIDNVVLEIFIIIYYALFDIALSPSLVSYVCVCVCAHQGRVAKRSPIELLHGFLCALSILNSRLHLCETMDNFWSVKKWMETSQKLFSPGDTWRESSPSFAQSSHGTISRTNSLYRFDLYVYIFFLLMKGFCSRLFSCFLYIV